jgi:hypothetical protein
MIDRGMKANNKVQEQVYHLDGFKPKGKDVELEEGQLDLSGYQESMEKIALGKVEGLEVGDLDVPEVDMDGVKLLVDSEKEEVAKQNQIKAKLDGEKSVEHVKNTFAESQIKAPEELAQIKGLESQIDKINYAQQLLKNPNMKPKTNLDGNEIEPYKPTRMERFKAFFAKGGMNEVLEKKKGPIIEQADRLKMQVQVKTDSNFVESVQKHATEGQKVMDQRMGQLERAAQFYEAAVQQVFDAQRTLAMDNNIAKSGMGKLLNQEGREEIQKQLREGQETMKKYEESYGEFKQLEHQKEVSVKSTNVRAELLKENAAAQVKPNTQTTQVKQGTAKIH